MSYYAIDVSNDLAHHGILGMKWGIRRYQNEDGSLTSAGRLRYYGNSGKARHYKDAMKTANKNYSRYNPFSKHGREYRKWVKEDPRNRTGQHARYELDQATKALGGKKGMADAKYAYEHKRLAKYINRDGSLTTAGKLKYWDTNKSRGQARMQRDIDRDKNSLTTSEKAAKKWKSTSNAYQAGKTAVANRDLIKAAIIGRQKDVTKYGRKNAKNIGKYALRTGLALATVRPLAAVRNATKLAKESSYGTAKAAIKTAKAVNGNVARSALSSAYLAKNYGTVPGKIKQTARNAYAIGTTRKRNLSLKDKALLGRDSNSYNYYNNLEKTAAVEKKMLDKANKASQYSYKTNKQTVQNIADTVTGKKKKKRS